MYFFNRLEPVEVSIFYRVKIEQDRVDIRDNAAIREISNCVKELYNKKCQAIREDPSSTEYITYMNYGTKHQMVTTKYFKLSSYSRARDSSGPFITGDNGDIACLLGDRLYFREETYMEYIKCLLSIVYLPLCNLIFRILLPTVKLIGWCFLDHEEKRSLHYTWKELVPVKALVYLVLSPLISIVGLLPYLTFYCNRINGALEGWTLGIDEDSVRNYSRKNRVRVFSLFFGCMQPVAIIPDNCIVNGNNGRRVIPLDKNTLISPRIKANILECLYSNGSNQGDCPRKNKIKVGVPVFIDTMYVPDIRLSGRP